VAGVGLCDFKRMAMSHLSTIQQEQGTFDDAIVQLKPASFGRSGVAARLLL